MADPLSLAFAERHPREVARLLEREPPDAAAEFLETAAIDGTSAIASLMAPDFATLCLAAMAPEAAARLIREMPVAAAAEICRRTDPATRARWLAALPDRQRAKVMAGLNMPSDAVGSRIDSQVITVRDDANAEEAVRRAKLLPERLQKYLYVIDAAGALAGVLDARDLMLAPPTQPVRALMQRRVISVPARAPIESVRDHFGWRQFHILPVVDRDGTFQGVIRARDLPKGTAGSGGGAEPLRGLGDAIFALTDMLWAAGADILVSGTRQRFDPDSTRK